MEFTTLERTGLRVSVAGLGCGGGSRLGMARNESEAHSIGLVHQAMDLGVNLIDTARNYGTEPRTDCRKSLIWTCPRMSAFRGKADTYSITVLSPFLTGTDSIKILPSSFLDPFNVFD